MEVKELIEVKGGTVSLTSGTFINAISKLINTLLDVGRAIGSALNYSKHKTSCNKTTTTTKATSSS